GPEVDALCGRLGIAVERSGGLRVTSPEALDVAEMVLSGRLNKRLVRALIGAGL
ncbi:MAG: acetylglutamate kinase, partial [Gemmatimonadetes bacterium]|nr:acetylglutamate kinase [Gemmatimonadota bacterium]NIQ56942.1 acetylglutamate kinase [Gemmatimonadota bacterium]NIU77113.1 acetylglutamate kinase [Gammaproteobacteria bacterium]NIX46434.1 acetylglutamate kinase [Gemmatimonadota bacterium]